MNLPQVLPCLIVENSRISGHPSPAGPLVVVPR
jgi:hypothetical protein